MNLSYLVAQPMKEQDSKHGNTAMYQTAYHLCTYYLNIITQVPEPE